MLIKTKDHYTHFRFYYMHHRLLCVSKIGCVIQLWGERIRREEKFAGDHWGWQPNLRTSCWIRQTDQHEWMLQEASGQWWNLKRRLSWNRTRIEFYVQCSHTLEVKARIQKWMETLLVAVNKKFYRKTFRKMKKIWQTYTHTDYRFWSNWIFIQ